MSFARPLLLLPPLVLLQLLGLLVVDTTCQQEATRPGASASNGWDRFSRLIPTNLVYEQRDRANSSHGWSNAGVDVSIDENNVMDTSKSKVASIKGVVHEEDEGEQLEQEEDQENVEENVDVYDDDDDEENEEDEVELEEAEDDHGHDRREVGARNDEKSTYQEAKVPSEGTTSFSSVGDDLGVAGGKAAAPSSELLVEDATRDKGQSRNGTSSLRARQEAPKERNYSEEDRSTGHYDAYYYYDDYESGNRSRYEAADAGSEDYADAEDTSTTEVGSSNARHGEEKDRFDDKKVESKSAISTFPSSSTSSIVVTYEKKEEQQEQEEEEEEEEKEKHHNVEVEDGHDDEDSSIEVTTIPEEFSSMEGSEKSFTIVGPPPSRSFDDPLDASFLIGEAVVSVVTTKSVVNGTISIPTSTSAPLTTEQVAPPPSSRSYERFRPADDRSISTSTTPRPEITTEDNSRILASVQTSRSISGARFLPFPVIDRVEQVDQDRTSNNDSPGNRKKTSVLPESTESIIDKLDRVQSELFSGFLDGGFRNAGNALHLDVLPQRESVARRRFTTTARTPVISKFVPRRYNDRRLDHAGTNGTLLSRQRFDAATTLALDVGDHREPEGLATTTPRAKIAFRWPSGRTTTSTEATIRVTTPPPSRKVKTNAVAQDISAFLPPGYKLKKEDAETTERSVLSDILAKSKVDISSLLPPDYNKKNDESSRTTIATTAAVALATGIMSEATSERTVADDKTSIRDLFASSKFDISALLPRDYDQKKKDLTETSTTKISESQHVVNNGTEVVAETVVETTTKAAGLKIVFPSRPGGRKPIHKITTPQGPRGDAPLPVTPRIQKGWPTRATTEFTGWPTPSTTPISIEKLLEAARTATVASVNTSFVPTTSVAPSTSTTTTTTTTPRSTTPGTCEEDCEVAGTIRIIGNTTWVPELFDRNTQEWQKLANEVEKEINFIFSDSPVLMHWYKKIRIDSFSPGSVLVDFFVELAELQQKVNTQELKVIFHDSLRTYNLNHWNDTRTKGTMRFGIFTIDPKFTDFVVIPKMTRPHFVENDNRLVPQWAIVVIVIGVGGLLFITVFGISVLVNRQNVMKLKPSVTAIYDEEVVKSMVNSANASLHRSNEYPKQVHTIWTDPDVSWNDKSFESTSNKVLMDRTFQDNKKYNLYDSWRSEWNGYYYNPSHTSSKYGGYDSTTNLSSRHHPDYDTNF